MRYEILLQTGYWAGPTYTPNVYLDTFEDVSISLNYNIADISDISVKKSSYSKTIDLPDTPNNREVFSNIFDLNVDLQKLPYESSFNPNKKVKFYVLKDGLNQFDGNLQLTNVNYNFDTKTIIYQTVIYADNDNLFKSIGENYLSNLDLDRYNHFWTYENIQQSWTASIKDGYIYPFIDYGKPFNLQNNFKVTDLYPAIYVKTLVDQIFTESGYSYTSNFFFKQYV